jgi:hypothetical protein
MLAVETAATMPGCCSFHTNDNDADELELLDRLNDRLDVGWLLAVCAQAGPAVVGLWIVCYAQSAPPDQLPIWPRCCPLSPPNEYRDTKKRGHGDQLLLALQASTLASPWLS